jgi:hypothetical protein
LRIEFEVKGVEVRTYHHLDQFVESDGWGPVQLRAQLARIAHELSRFCGVMHGSVFAHILPIIQAEKAKSNLTKHR